MTKTSLPHGPCMDGEDGEVCCSLTAAWPGKRHCGRMEVLKQGLLLPLPCPVPPIAGLWGARLPMSSF